MSSSCARRLGCTSWEGPRHRRSHPPAAAGPRPFPAKLSAHLPRLIGPAPGVPGWLRLPGTVGLLRQNGRRVFPSPLCFSPTKGRVRVGARLCSAAWQPGRSSCQRDPGRLARGYKGADLPLLPGFLPSLSFPFSLSLPRVPAHIQAASRPGCQGERRPCPGRARAGGGRRGSWHQKGKKRKKHFSHCS